MSKDFRSKQIRTIKLIGSSSTAGSIVSGRPNLSLLLYGDAGSSNYDGGLETTLTSKLSSGIGDDAWMVVSGSANNGTGGRAAGGTVAFLGDVVISGTLYSERMIVEVDSTVPGDFFVKNDTLISGSIALGPTTNEAGGATGDLLIADKTPVQSYRDAGTAGNSGATLHGGVVTFRKLFPVAGKPGAGGGVVASITNGGDGGSTDGSQAVSRMPQDVWFHVSGAIGGRHFSGDGQKGTKRHRGVALFDGDLHTSGNLSLDGTFTFAGEVGNDIVLINNSPSVANPESPSYFIASNVYTPITSSGRNAFMELATDQTSRAALNGPHWWVDLVHSGTNQDYGGLKFKVSDQAFGGTTGGKDANGIPKFSHRHEMRLRADGNLVLQSDVNNDYSKIGSSGRRRGIVFSGSDAFGGTNHYARISYKPYKGGQLQFGHLTTGSYNFKDGVLSASNGIQFPEGDFNGSNGAVANFGQQHGLMFQGSGAGRPEAGLYFNSATRVNPILAGDASTLLLKMNSSQVADSIHIQNQTGTGTDAIKLIADNGGMIAKAGGTISIDSVGGEINLQRSEVTRLRFDIDSTQEATIQAQEAGGDIIFRTTADGSTMNEIMRIDQTASSLLMASSNKVEFRDTDAAIHSTVSGQLDIDATSKLDIVSTGTTNEAVKITANTGGGGITMAAGTGGASITAGGTIALDGGTGVSIQGNASEVDITTTGNVDVNGAAITIDATVGISLDSAAPSNFTMTTDAATPTTMTIAATNAGSSVSNIDVDADGTVDIDGASGINIGTAADVAIDINSSTLDIDASGAITIDGTSTLSMDSADTTNLSMAANDASSKSMTIMATNAGGGSGNLVIDASDLIQIGATGATSMQIGHPGTLATFGLDAQDIDIDGNSVTIDAIAGGLSLDGTGASNFSTTTGDITISSSGGRVILSGSSAVDSVLIDHDARFNGDVLMKGNLTVEGDFIKGHVITASVGDPLLLLNSGSTVSNSGGGIAIASGSNIANVSLVFGRDTLHQNTILAGMKDVRDGLEDTLSSADPVLFRASGYDLGTRYASTPFITSSNPTRTPGTAGTLLTQAQRLLRMHISMSNRSTNGDILMRMDGNLIVSSSNMALKNGSKLFLNPTSFDGGPYYIQSDTANNRLALGVGTGALWLKSSAGNASRIAFDDDGKNIREISNELRMTSDEGIGLQAAGDIDIDATGMMLLDSTDTTALSMNANDAGNKFLTIKAFNAGSGQGVLNLTGSILNGNFSQSMVFGNTAPFSTSFNATNFDLNATQGITIDADSGGVSIDAAGGDCNFSAAAGKMEIKGKANAALAPSVKIHADHGPHGGVLAVTSSVSSFKGPIYFSEDPAVGGPYYVVTGSASYKKLTFNAGNTGTFRLAAPPLVSGKTSRAQLEFDDTAVIRNVSSSYFAVESRAGLRLDGNKNNNGGENFGIQLSGSVFSFQQGKKIFLNENPSFKSYIQHDGLHLQIANKDEIRLIDVPAIQFFDQDSAIGICQYNKRLFINSSVSGAGQARTSDMLLSSSNNDGRITLQISASSGAALQLRGHAAAGKGFIGAGYVSGTLETKITENKDANFILSGAVDGIHDSRVRYKSKVSQGGYQRGVALFMGDLLTSGAVHVEKNMIVSGAIVTKGDLLEFTNGTMKIEKDGGNNLKFTDPNAGGITLTELNSKVLGADQTFLIAPGGPGNNFYTQVRTTGSFSFDYNPTNGTYNPRSTSAIGSDVYFFVSGTVGGKTAHRQKRTVAVFGGDIHISGTLTSDNTAFGGSLNTSYDSPDGGGTLTPGAGAVIVVDNRPVQLKRSSTPTSYSADTLLSVSGSSSLHNLTIGPGLAAPDVRLSVTGSSGAMTFASNPGGGGQRDIFSITGGSGNIQISPHASEGKLAFAQESSTYIRLDNSSTPKDLQIYNTTATGKITLKTGTGAGSPGSVEIQGHILPTVDNAYNLGSPTQRYANLYTGDLHLRNDRGDWTIYEEPDMLVVVNNLTGKKYKMNLTPLEDKE